MRRKLIIIGANGHGKVISDIALATGAYDDIAFLCNFDGKKECMGYPVAGRIGDAGMYIGEADFFVAVGDAQIRRRITEYLESFGEEPVTLVHPSAVIGSRVSLDSGCAVMAGAVIQAESELGRGCIVNTCASVDHGCRLGCYVHVAVGAHVCGTVKIGDNTWIGAGAIVRNGVNICGDCMIGAGAVVTGNIKEKGTYIGIPAKMRDSANTNKIPDAAFD